MDLRSGRGELACVSADAARRARSQPGRGGFAGCRRWWRWRCVVAGLLGAPVWPGASDAQGDELTLAAPPVVGRGGHRSPSAAPTSSTARAATPARASARPPAHAVAPHGAAPRARRGRAAPAPAAPTTPAAPSTPAASESPREHGPRRADRQRDWRRRRLDAPAPKPEPTAAPAQPGPVQQTVAAVREAAAPVTARCRRRWRRSSIRSSTRSSRPRRPSTRRSTRVTGLLQRKP